MNNYNEIISTSKVSKAEATIAWFYSGKKQPLIDVVLKVPTTANGIHNCAPDLQLAINNGDYIFIPSGEYEINRPINLNKDSTISGAGFEIKCHN